MDKKERKRRRWRWLAGIGAAVLLILVGLAPLFLLITYPRTGWLDLFLNREGQEENSSGEESSPETYMVQYLYRYCRHGEVYSSEKIPLDYPEPPNSLVEIALAFQNSNLNIENLLSEIRVPEGWHLAEICSDREQPLYLLTCLEDLCPECAGQQYLGLFQDHIAVFRGVPPEGELVEVTEIKVKEIDRELLEKGLPFDSEEQKRMYLETFTS